MLQNQQPIRRVFVAGQVPIRGNYRHPGVGGQRMHHPQYMQQPELMHQANYMPSNYQYPISNNQYPIYQPGYQPQPQSQPLYVYRHGMSFIF